MPLNTRSWPAQDALLEILKADTQLSAWTITYGWPMTRPTQLNIWAAEDLNDVQQTPYGTGTTATREETFRFDLYIFAQKTGADAYEIREEIRTAADRVASLLGANQTLSGTVLLATIEGFAYEGAPATPEGRAREGVLKLTILCTAYLGGA